MNKLNVLPNGETASIVIFKVGNEKIVIWKRKKKGLKMHIKTKETFPNMVRNCRFTFSTLKKNVLKWYSNQHEFWQCSLTNWLSTNWANQVHAIRRQFLHHFNDQLGEAWFCKSTRIDGITSIQRTPNIFKRALSRFQLSSKCLV